MKLCVVGTGYVGLVSAACFAEMGNEVRCVDINDKVIDRLRKGEIPIYEPGLEDIVKRNKEENRLTFTTDLDEGLADATMVFICVGTPSRPDGSCDLSYVMQVASEIGKKMQEPLIVVNKSTVPVGTADAVHAVIAQEQSIRGVTIPVSVVSNPEFLKEGAAIADFMKPDRVIVGTDDDEVAGMMRELYAPFAVNRDKLIVTGIRSAEMIKYASNCMLATKISFINEIASICERVGADVREVRTGIGADHRIGPHFIYPGLGYGGSCFPKDVRALIFTAKEAGVQPELLKAVENVNERQRASMARRIGSYFSAQGGVEGQVLAVWGLAFKANTDDLRESPSMSIIQELVRRGMQIRAYDPVAGEKAREELKDLPEVTIVDDQYEVLQGAAALLVATEWNQFRTPDFNRMKGLLQAPIIFDGRNLFSGKDMASKGFAYFCVGKG